MKLQKIQDPIRLGTFPSASTVEGQPSLWGEHMDDETPVVPSTKDLEWAPTYRVFYTPEVLPDFFIWRLLQNCFVSLRPSDEMHTCPLIGLMFGVPSKCWWLKLYDIISLRRTNTVQLHHVPCKSCLWGGEIRPIWKNHEETTHSSPGQLPYNNGNMTMEHQNVHQSIFITMSWVLPERMTKITGWGVFLLWGDLVLAAWKKSFAELSPSTMSCEAASRLKHWKPWMVDVGCVCLPWKINQM